MHTTPVMDSKFVARQHTRCRSGRIAGGQTKTTATHWKRTSHEGATHVTNFLHRPFPISEHPLSDRNYRLPTPPIEELYALIIDALKRRRTGIMAYGLQRMGKTTAIDYLVAL